MVIFCFWSPTRSEKPGDIQEIFPELFGLSKGTFKYTSIEIALFCVNSYDLGGVYSHTAIAMSHSIVYSTSIVASLLLVEPELAIS
ncbi:hypothetical protein SCA6_002953 [Theobroma cacao]